MEKIVILLCAFALIGCGEKEKSNDSAESAQDAGPLQPAKEEAEVASSGPEPLISDADVERLLKEAVDFDSLEERDDLFYQNNEAFSGWTKKMYDSGQVQALGQLKDSKPHGLLTEWHENGQKRSEATFKDGELISEKWWNAKGEEVETREETEE